MTARLPADATWRLEGRLVEASNVVLRLVDDAGDDDTRDDETRGGEGATPIESAARAVYKPVKGERPLADFPDATLAHREVAAWLVADAAGWGCVPETAWYDGEFGPGSLQRWVGPLEPPEQNRVALLDEEELEQNPHVHAIAAFEGDEGALVLVHTDDEQLRAIALLDVVINNADRKGSHLIEDGESLFAIDNGLSFHVDDKLRTVLWGFSGKPLGDEERAALDRLVTARDELGRRLGEHLGHDEIVALHRRIDELRSAAAFPMPPDDRYALPWPPL